MTNHPGWYPPGQVCYPPELPEYFRSVYTLKPIVGIPSDEEVIEIHSVIDAVNRVSGIPKMHDPGLSMKLASHLFNAQMAKYRSKYSLVTFPSDATYTPPSLPAHVDVSLEPVAGAPSDEEIVRVQNAVRAYQHFSSVASMFDPHVNMELSQHLFNIQMARYMRLAGETQAQPEPQATEYEIPTQTAEGPLNPTNVATNATNNVGSGRNAIETDPAPHPVHSIEVRELMERSNQLAERFNQLLERSNELVEQSTQPANLSNQLTERFNQTLDRFNQLVEKTCVPARTPDQPIDRFNQLFDRFNQVVSQLVQPMQQSNQLAERLNQLIEGFNQPLQRSNELSEKANQLAEQLNQSSERSSQLAELSRQPVEKLEGVLRYTNKVLAGIQHAIIRNHKGNTVHAVDCLINEKGETYASSDTAYKKTFDWVSKYRTGEPLPVVIGGSTQHLSVPNSWLAGFLRFHGIWEGVCDNENSDYVIKGKEKESREWLSSYLSTCLG